MATILVIDDESSILHAFRRAFADPEDTLQTASDGAEGLELVARSRPDVVVLDLNLPDMSGMDVFRRIRTIDARIPVIFITGQGTTETAIEAMKQGAFDYLLKPLDVARVRELVERAAEISRLMRIPAMVADEAQVRGPDDVLIGRSPAMQEVYKAIGLVAPQDLAVLILGESGTGKELVARAVYQHSRRAAGPFLAINCAAIPETLLESELFGHEKGAFTGADRRRIGKFEQCSGGTLFLDEIGDMTPLTQAKVLRVLQDGRFERVGGNETVRSDVRVIAATNRDLEQMVAAGEFRGDLYYRLGIVTITLPPLRERAEDSTAPGRSLPQAVRPRAGEGGRSDCSGRPGGAPSPRLAREHPGAAERPEAGAVAVTGSGPRRRLPAGLGPWGGGARGHVRGPLRLGGLPRGSPPRRLAGPVCRGAGGDGAVAPDARAPPHPGQPAPGGEGPGDHPRQPADEDPHARHHDRALGVVGGRPGGRLNGQAASALHRRDRVLSVLGTISFDRTIRCNSF